MAMTWRRSRSRTAWWIGAAAVVALLALPAVPSVRRYARMKMM